MNRIIYSLLILIVIPMASVLGQTDIDKIFDKYKGQEGCTTVNVSPDVLAGSEKDNSNETMELIKSIEKVKILTVKSDDQKDPNRHFKFFKDVKKSINFNDYDEVMSVDDKDTEVYVLKNKGDKISEVILLTRERKEANLIKFTGNLDLDKVMKLSKKYNSASQKGRPE